MPDPLTGIPGRSRFLFELLLALTLTRLPWLGIPFKWLESFFHELSHAFMTVISGGEVSHISLFANGAGLCFSEGGMPVLIGIAGYAGAALWGGLLFSLATWPRGIRTSYALLGTMVLGVIVAWGRDLLTLSMLLCLAILFFLPLRLSQASWLVSGLRIMGLMVMLNALASPTVLLGMGGRGDAALLAELTWLPEIFWIVLWLLLALSVLYLCWRRVERISLARDQLIGNKV
ncbi:M50 family metallopeptidase [Shewanella cyperi]|uniref:M50 family metallopeptidase n=1 Tax=Shewanella cyperi TaxID=2814292 RepID=A0A974XQP2_9GAMM|nr:M50 family metallopeptidase [Shewanella cyperi]QSX31526.1 M50 family metallopeptidase [Shewanella cyperi]QSX42306.1 M50 family metallopeptidase [Shewanella cyperi]